VQRDGALSAALLGEPRHETGEIDGCAGRVERRNVSSQGPVITHATGLSPSKGRLIRETTCAFKRGYAARAMAHQGDIGGGLHSSRALHPAGGALYGGTERRLLAYRCAPRSKLCSDSFDRLARAVWLGHD
jgi:hypothetical protein